MTQHTTFEKWRFKSIWNITKHTANPSMEYLESHHIDPEGPFSHEQLHVVIIKDPLTWMKSICKQPYYINPLRADWFRDVLCPFGLHEYNGTASGSEWRVHIYSSLIEVWNRFYESWMDSAWTPMTAHDSAKWASMHRYASSKYHKHKQDQSAMKRAKYALDMLRMDMLNDNLNETERILVEEWQRLARTVEVPKVVVRFEDVLFDPQEVVDRICHCVQGVRRDGSVMVEGASKPHGGSRNREQALKSYSNQIFRD